MLTWLLLRGIDTNAPGIRKRCGRSTISHSPMPPSTATCCRRGPGLLHSYGSVVQAVAAMEDAVARLRSRAKADGLDAGPVDRLAAAGERQEKLTERIKNNNVTQRSEESGGCARPLSVAPSSRKCVGSPQADQPLLPATPRR